MSENPIVELSDDELEAIPRDKRVRIVQAQIEGGRAELADLYKKLEEYKLSNSELDYKLRDINAAVVDERKKLQQKRKNNDKLSEELKQLRAEVAQQENKLHQLAGDDSQRNPKMKESDVDRLAAQLDREQANVLKLQAAIEKRRNELASIDAQFKAETDDMKAEFEALTQEKKKTLDLISLEMQKLNHMKQRKITALRGIASHTLDSQLTAVLETLGDGTSQP